MSISPIKTLCKWILDKIITIMQSSYDYISFGASLQDNVRNNSYKGIFTVQIV